MFPKVVASSNLGLALANAFGVISFDFKLRLRRYFASISNCARAARPDPEISGELFGYSGIEGCTYCWAN